MFLTLSSLCNLTLAKDKPRIGLARALAEALAFRRLDSDPPLAESPELQTLCESLKSRCLDADKMRQSCLALAGIFKGVGGLGRMKTAFPTVSGFKKTSDEHIYLLSLMQANAEVLGRGAEPWATSAWMKETLQRFAKVGCSWSFLGCGDLKTDDDGESGM